MQKDMHFYGVYALARAAGVKSEVARIIAYASQFVDDAIEGEISVLKNRASIFPIITSHKPIDYKNTILRDQWKVWVPFHFLPGNQKTSRTFIGRMMCRKGTDSDSSKAILKHALQHKATPFGPHIAGITAHVYADTFAHYGFAGLSNPMNKVKNDSIIVDKKPISKRMWKYIETKFETFKARLVGTLAESIPVGHGAVATYPDRPYLIWQYKYETGKLVKRNNPKDYLAACENLHKFFCDFLQDQPAFGKPDPHGWSNIKNVIQTILKKNGRLDDRINEWLKAIAGNKLFTATAKDKAIKYSDQEWISYSIAEHLDVHGDLIHCNGSLFIRAAWKHRNYVLHDLLPDIGLIA